MRSVVAWEEEGRWKRGGIAVVLGGVDSVFVGGNGELSGIFLGGFVNEAVSLASGSFCKVFSLPWECKMLAIDFSWRLGKLVFFSWFLGPLSICFDLAFSMAGRPAV